MDHESFSEPALIAVNAAHLRELTHRYAEYHQYLTAPGDPVKALDLMGDVLSSVRQLVIGQAQPRDGDRTGRGMLGCLSAASD